MGLCLTFQGAAKSNFASHNNERGLFFFGFGGFKSFGNSRQIIGISNFQDLPAIGFITRGNILIEGEIGRAFNGDFIAVIDHNEFAQLLCPRKRTGFMSDAFLQTAVPGEDIGVMINNLIAFAVEFSGQTGLSHGHADGRGKSLSQRARADLYSRSHTIFRMAGGFTVQLTERGKIFFFDSIAKKIKERIEESGHMAGA